MDWAPSITICASTRECSWRATWTIQLTFTASVTQWPVTIWTRFSFWQCSSTRPWWQVQEHEHYLSTQQWASTCIRATFHTYSGYHCPEKTFQAWIMCSPAQVLIRSLLLSSSTQRKQFRMIVVRDTQKTFRFPFWLVPSVSVRRCHPTSLAQS
jgi:hypothetical protein